MKHLALQLFHIPQIGIGDIKICLIYNSQMTLIHEENTKENYNRVNYTVVKNFQKLSQLSPRFFL